MLPNAGIGTALGGQSGSNNAEAAYGRNSSSLLSRRWSKGRRRRASSLSCPLVPKFNNGTKDVQKLCVREGERRILVLGKGLDGTLFGRERGGPEGASLKYVVYKILEFLTPPPLD